MVLQYDEESYRNITVSFAVIFLKLNEFSIVTGTHIIGDQLSMPFICLVLFGFLSKWAVVIEYCTV
ncbi:hypothetical protein KFK09_002856 [Dendrobium nobile]|uniref:Uncharacterized protein n=1 Tax=Dendrobium nobile TaxID=94219 RepID=A0A8T3C2I5_DENNO|nr:hypothetical protein KFK09_002856 [Dendrobium nobile]